MRQYNTLSIEILQMVAIASKVYQYLSRNQCQLCLRVRPASRILFQGCIPTPMV
jgi:hypothetical protein